MDVFETLAEPTRRRIVELLIDRDLSVSEICREFPISQPAVSRHLKVLREASLVTSRVDAQRRLYSLQPEPLKEMESWLERVSSFWNRRLEDLGALLAEDDDEDTKGKGERQ